MPAKLKDQLHELIRSLSGSEKRYYKLYASRHQEESTMVLLFDFIARQPAYDESEIRRNLEGKALLNQFSTVKKRLYDHILQALHAFHTHSSPGIQAYLMLHQAELLFSKSLFDQCYRLLKSIEKMAIKQELFTVLIQVNKQRQRLYEMNRLPANHPVSSDDTLQTDILLMKEQLIYQLTDLHETFTTLEKSTASTENIESLFGQLGEIGKRQLTYPAEALYLHYSVQCIYYSIKAESEKSLECLGLMVAHLQDHPLLTEKRPEFMLSALGKLCLLLLAAGDTDKCNAFLFELKEWKQNTELNEQLQLLYFSISTEIELNMIIQTGEFDTNRRQLQRIAAQLENNREQLAPSAYRLIYLKLGIIAYGNEKMTEASQHFSTLLADPTVDPKNETTVTARMMELILLMEGEHFALIDNRTRSALRALKTLHRNTETEQLFLRGIRQLANAHPLDHPELLQQLFRQLTALIENRNLRPAATMQFDYLTWIESRIRKQSFAQSVREKNRFLAVSA